MNARTLEPPEKTDREYRLYQLLKKAASHDKGLAAALEEWRDIWFNDFEGVLDDAHQLQRTRDALVKKILAMFTTAREHDAEFFDSHGHDMVHMIAEGVMYPERHNYSRITG